MGPVARMFALPSSPDAGGNHHCADCTEFQTSERPLMALSSLFGLSRRWCYIIIFTVVCSWQRNGERGILGRRCLLRLGWFLLVCCVARLVHLHLLGVELSRQAAQTDRRLFIHCNDGANNLYPMVVFAASLVFSVDLVDYGISDEERGSIACYVDTANSCTNCYPNDEGWDPTEPQCPEWTLDDVVKVLQTQLKQSATLAAIFLIYAFSALRFGFVLRSHVSRYQIEYV